MLDHLEISEEMAKKVRGRGQVNIKKAIPQPPNEAEKIKSPMMRKANEYLRQARRCEALGHRIIKSRNEGGRKEKHIGC